jgi:hypothetical protein
LARPPKQVLGWFETVCFPRKRKKKLGMQEDRTKGLYYQAIIHL